MGCIFSFPSIFRRKEESIEPPKQYSWDNRQKVDPKDFTIENQTGVTTGRLPGSIKGQQFIIQNCQDCDIYVFDNSATISVDDCVNCRIFLAPIKTSVFVRDCTRCKLMIACQQFRTRDCKKLDVFLCCTTQPIIEASTGMKFGCFQYYYPELEGKMVVNLKTSVFVRDCTRCKLMIACQQFRTRDCKKLDVFLCCTTQPIIEASTGMKFGCFQYYYPELEEQFRLAGLSVYNNNWSNIHDFTPVAGEKNFSLLPSDAVIDDYIPLPQTDQFAPMIQSVNTDRSTSVVPTTCGPKRTPCHELCLVVFFHDETVLDRVKRFIQELRSRQDGCILVQTKEVTMDPSDAQRVFTSNNYEKAVLQGPVIGLEYDGPDSCMVCHNALMTDHGPTGPVFVSATGKEAIGQVDNFYSFADMQMNL